jgi:hypothetical protein
MSDPKVTGTEIRPTVMPQRFLDELDRVKRRKSFWEGQTPDAVAAKLRRHLSGGTQRQPEGS